MCVPAQSVLRKFGYDHLDLNKPGLRVVLDDAGEEYEDSDGVVHLLQAVERYFALQREEYGEADRKFLKETFDPHSYSIPQLRQVLSRYEVDYHTAKAKKDSLVALFQANIDEIRQLTGYDEIPKARKAGFRKDRATRKAEEELDDSFERMSIIDDDSDDSAATAPPPRSAKSITSAPKSGRSESRANSRSRKGKAPEKAVASSSRTSSRESRATSSSIVDECIESHVQVISAKAVQLLQGGEKKKARKALARLIDMLDE